MSLCDHHHTKTYIQIPASIKLYLNILYNQVNLVLSSIIYICCLYLCKFILQNSTHVPEYNGNDYAI